MSEEYRIQNGNLSLSLTGRVKLLLKVNYFVISAVPLPHPGDLRIPGLCMVTFWISTCFLVAGARLMLGGACWVPAGVGAVEEQRPAAGAGGGGDAVYPCALKQVANSSSGIIFRMAPEQQCWSRRRRGTRTCLPMPERVAGVGLEPPVAFGAVPQQWD